MVSTLVWKVMSIAQDEKIMNSNGFSRVFSLKAFLRTLITRSPSAKKKENLRNALGERDYQKSCLLVWVVLFKLWLSWNNNPGKISMEIKRKVSTNNFLSTCSGFFILWPSWRKLTTLLPSMRGYGEPPKRKIESK